MIYIQTDHPIAYESMDHQVPHGTKNDNLHNPGWVERMIGIFGQDMKYADLGTSGGGLVKDFLDRGVFAVGVDGSDYSKRHNRAEWATIPNNLFTADITKPWSFWDHQGKGVDVGIEFDLITTFDVMEHIPEFLIQDTLVHINRNLKDGGYTQHSIAEFPDPGYHVTLYPAQWWIEQFARAGFVHLPELADEGNYARVSSHNLTFKKIWNA